MALKDCTFTVNVGGKAQVMDYDQLRLFLMKPKNMAAVAPTFAGQSGAGPSKLRQGVEPEIVNEAGPLWRSTLGLAMESWANKGTPEQLMAHIAKTKGAAEEAKWVELGTFLEGKKTVTKQEVMDYLEANPFVLGEVVLQGAKIRYPESQHRLPGGQKEGELVITFPQIKGYRAHHFPEDTDSYLVQVRFNERRGVNGQRILFIEEIQSDLHQKGRVFGYTTPEVKEQRLKELKSKQAAIGRRREILRNNDEKIGASILKLRDVIVNKLAADAAFKPERQTPYGMSERTLQIQMDLFEFMRETESASDRAQRWGSEIEDELELTDATLKMSEAVKRNGLLNDVLRLAEAYRARDRITIQAGYLDRESFDLDFQERQRQQLEFPEAPYKPSSEWATLAAKRMLRWAAENGYDEMAWTTGEVQTERTGTEFYKFYDEILPKNLAKFIKQWGSIIEQTDIEIPGEGVMTFPAVKMSPRMRNAALQGMTLFQKEKAARPQAPSTLMQADSPRRVTWPTVDMFPTVNELTEERLADVPKQRSSVKTGKEARELLATMVSSDDAEYAALQELKRKMSEARRPLIEGGRGKSPEQKAKLEADFVDAVNALKKAYARYSLRNIDAIAPGGLAEITWNGYQTEEQTITTGPYSSTLLTAKPGITEEVQRRINKGVLRFQRIVGDNPRLKGKKVDVRIVLPSTDRFRQHYSLHKVDNLEMLGPFSPPGEGHVALLPDTSNSVIVHELGHWMEHAIPETTEMIGKFLKRRARGEHLNTLNTLNATTVYDNRELAVKDKFIDAYIGKYYGHRELGPYYPTFKPKWDAIYASEVLSMGVQYMNDDPLKFAQQDPDMFDLIFDILRIGR